jgi:hypothetical protein
MITQQKKLIFPHGRLVENICNFAVVGNPNWLLLHPSRNIQRAK